LTSAMTRSSRANSCTYSPPLFPERYIDTAAGVKPRSRAVSLTLSPLSTSSRASRDLTADKMRSRLMTLNRRQIKKVPQLTVIKST